MSSSAVDEPDRPALTTTAQLFRRFLQAYWLRPENGLWMTLRSQVLSQYPLEHPVVDLSCGDGVFSFLHAGGTFHPDFDVFRSVQCPGNGRDERGDLFDCWDEDYRPEIASPPVDTIDVGTDWKATLLGKAQRLSFYHRLVRTDHNNPLPLEDSSFRTVYCNAAYWVENIHAFLSELSRITRPDGRIVLQVKLDAIRKYTLRRYRDILGDRFLQIIDRGRMESWPNLANRVEWEDRFHRAGLVVEQATPFMTGTHAHVWDIGLRPIAPMLIRMSSGLDPSTRASVKRDWVDLFHELLLPFCRPKFSIGSGLQEPVEIQYVLRPR